MSKKNLLRILYGAIVLLGVGLDQLTKMLAVKYLSDRGTLPILEGVLHLTYVENRGAAFGMLSNHRWVFLVFSTVAILAMGFYLFRGVSYLSEKGEDGAYPSISLLGGVALAMIVSGGIGNMIDRVALGYVVDFIDFTLIDFAVFNVADSFVTVGAVLLALHLLLPLFQKKKK